MKRPFFERKLLSALVILVGIAMLVTALPVAAQGNSIDNVVVSIPACSGFAGRLGLTVTIDANNDRWISNTLSNVSNNIGLIFGPGTHIFDNQFIPPPGTNPGDILTVTVKLGTQAFSDNLDSETIQFNCSTGQIVNPPVANDDATSTPANTPVLIDVAANDTDADGNLDPTTTVALSNPTNGSAVNHGDGTFTYTPNTNFIGFDGFTYEICDTDGLCDDATVTIEVINQPPDCSEASPSVDTLWPPNHQMVPVEIVGVTDPDNDPITIVIDGIDVDEPNSNNGDGNHDPDTDGVGTDTAQVRAERSGGGEGRTYHIHFTADDGLGGTCQGTVDVNVPHDQRGGSGNPPPNPANSSASENPGSGNGPPPNPGNGNPPNNPGNGNGNGPPQNPGSGNGNASPPQNPGNGKGQGKPPENPSNGKGKGG